MVIKEGYKQTEIGVIPNDWEVKKLGEVLKVIGGGAFKSTDNSRIGIKWLKIANVGINQAVWNEENYLPLDLVKENQNFLLHEGDYVIALTRPILDKKLKITKLTKNDVPALLNQRVGKIEVEKDNDNDFAYFLFQKSGTINALLQSMAGTDPPNLSNKGIYNIDCALPPTLIEQTAIATALSDADGLITGLEKLIAKKRNIKQGTMQQLLQPKEGWEVKKLGELFKLSASKSKSNYLTDGGKFIIMDMGSVSSVGTIIKSKRTNHKSDLLNFGDLVMPKDDIGGGNIIGKVGFIDQSNSYVLGDHVYKLEVINSNINSLYFYFLINSAYVNKHFRAKASGSAQLGLGRKSVLEQELFFPKAKAEQTHIASILSEMDAELSALEQKLEKYKKIKLGMMQELLTGKTRLV